MSRAIKHTLKADPMVRIGTAVLLAVISLYVVAILHPEARLTYLRLSDVPLLVMAMSVPVVPESFQSLDKVKMAAMHRSSGSKISAIPGISQSAQMTTTVRSLSPTMLVETEA